MFVWVVDLAGFLLLCVGSRLATPRLLKLLCRIAVLYILIFTAGYYYWLRPSFQHFNAHPNYGQTEISMAFKFQGFWSLLGNMVLLQAILPVGVCLTVYFAVKWLAADIRFESRR
jgi:Kef-type K+ transport system membrane component KefB